MTEQKYLSSRQRIKINAIAKLLEFSQHFLWLYNGLLQSMTLLRVLIAGDGTVIYFMFYLAAVENFYCN